MVTFPEMLLVPTTSNTMLRFAGVNVTSKREAEKLLLVMHGLSELDVRMRSAHVKGDSASSRAEIKDAIESFMVTTEKVVVSLCFRADVGVAASAGFSEGERDQWRQGRGGGSLVVVVVVGVFTAGAESGCWGWKASDSGYYGKHTKQQRGWLEGEMCRICRRWLAQKSDPAL